MSTDERNAWVASSSSGNTSCSKTFANASTAPSWSPSLNATYALIRYATARSDGFIRRYERPSRISRDSAYCSCSSASIADVIFFFVRGFIPYFFFFSSLRANTRHEDGKVRRDPANGA